MRSRALTSPSAGICVSTSDPLRVYWYRRHANFGDQLTEVLLERLAGIRVRWTRAKKAEFVGAGSIAADLPRGFQGIVFGTGKHSADARIDLSRAHVLCVRGALTLEGSGASCDVLGDPGLLCGFIAPEVQPTRSLAVVPHLRDRSLAHRFDGHVVDVGGGVDRVISEVASCERVVTSSLHGLILADALGLPRRWELFPRVQADGFKFHDYASALGECLEPGRWQRANPATVAGVQARLLDLLQVVVDAVKRRSGHGRPSASWVDPWFSDRSER